jgi:predicted MFS family arabinose efflux permease
MAYAEGMSTEHEDGLSPALTFVFALATGALVANLYYAQGLVSVISPALGLHAGLAGLPVTLTQLGYAAGLIFLVSLADLVENRRLILLCVAGTVVGLCGAALSNSAFTFLLSSVVFGVCAVGAQIIIPFAAHLASERRRGAVIGNVMAGLITGIMLARPVANLIASAFGWRAVFGCSAAMGVAIFIVLWFRLPQRHPHSGMTYGQVLSSTWRILKTTPALQRRSIYQATMFGMFSLFWTAAPLVLSQRFGFDQRQIALFALAGAGGALAAPIAGRIADRGWTWRGTFGAMLIIVVAFAVTGWAAAAGFVIVLAIAAIALDAAMQGNQIMGQRLIYSIDPEARGRINAVYMTSIFLAGAGGSLLAGLTYFYGGWLGTAATGVCLGLALLAYFATEPRVSAHIPAMHDLQAATK